MAPWTMVVTVPEYRVVACWIQKRHYRSHWAMADFDPSPRARHWASMKMVETEVAVMAMMPCLGAVVTTVPCASLVWLAVY
jgi:hypothetical protein